MKQHRYMQTVRWFTVPRLRPASSSVLRCVFIVAIILTVASSTPQQEDTTVDFRKELPHVYSNSRIRLAKFTGQHGQREEGVERFYIQGSQKPRRNDISTLSDLRNIIRRFKMAKQYSHSQNRVVCFVMCTEVPGNKMYACQRSTNVPLAQRNIKPRRCASRYMVSCAQCEVFLGRDTHANIPISRSACLLCFFPDANFLNNNRRHLDCMAENDVAPRKQLTSSFKLCLCAPLDVEINAVQSEACMICTEKSGSEFYTGPGKRMRVLWKQALFPIFKTIIKNSHLPMILNSRYEHLFKLRCPEYYGRLQMCDIKNFHVSSMRNNLDLHCHTLFVAGSFLDAEYCHSSMNALLKVFKTGKLVNLKLLNVCRYACLRCRNKILGKWISQAIQARMYRTSEVKRMGVHCKHYLSKIWLMNDGHVIKCVCSAYNQMRTLDNLLQCISTKKQCVSKHKKTLLSLLVRKQCNQYRGIMCTVMIQYIQRVIGNFLNTCDIALLNIHTSSILRRNPEREIFRDNVMRNLRYILTTAYSVRRDQSMLISRIKRLHRRASIVTLRELEVSTSELRSCNRLTHYKHFIDKQIKMHRCVAVNLCLDMHKQADTNKRAKKRCLVDILKGGATKSHSYSLTREYLETQMGSVRRRFPWRPALLVVKTDGRARRQIGSMKPCLITFTYHNTFLATSQWLKSCFQKQYGSCKMILNRYSNVRSTQSVWITRQLDLLPGLVSGLPYKVNTFRSISQAHSRDCGAFVNSVTSIIESRDQDCGEFITCNFIIVQCSNVQGRNIRQKTKEKVEIARVNGNLVKIHPWTDEISYLTFGTHTTHRGSIQNLVDQNVLYLKTIINRWDKIERHLRYCCINFWGLRLRINNVNLNRGVRIKQWQTPWVDLLTALQRHTTNDGTDLRKDVSNSASSYSHARGTGEQDDAFRGSDKSMRAYKDNSHDLADKPVKNTVLVNLVQPPPAAQYTSNDLNKAINVLSHASSVLRRWLKLSEALKKTKQETGLSGKLNTLNNSTSHSENVEKYSLKSKSLLSQQMPRAQPEQKPERKFNKRYKRQNNENSDVIIKNDLMTDLRSKWLDMKEDINKLQEKIYDAKERIANVEEDIHRLLRRGDMLATANVKINSNNKLRNAMIQADWNLIQVEFNALQKEILHLQKQAEKADKFSNDKKDNRELNRIKNSFDAQKAIIDTAVQNILNLDEQKASGNNITQTMDSDTNHAANYFSNFEDDDITSQLNVLSGFSQGGKYYDPSLEHAENILKTFLSRHKRAALSDEFPKIADETLLTVRNLGREDEDDADADDEISDLRESNKVPSVRHDTLTRGRVPESIPGVANFSVSYPYFELLEGNETLALLYPNKSVKKSFVAEWAMIKKNTTEILKTVTKLKRMYSYIQLGIRNLKKKCKATQNKIINIIKSNSTINNIVKSKNWKMIWRDIKVLQTKINNYNFQFEKTDIDMFLQNISEKIDMVQKKLDAERSAIENELYVSSNPHTLLPFSTGAFTSLNEHLSTQISENENTHKTDSHSGNRKDINPDIVLEKLEKLIVFVKNASNNPNLTSVEEKLNKLISKHAMKNAHPTITPDDVVSRRRRSLRVKRRFMGGGGRRGRRRHRGRYYADDPFFSDTTSDDNENPAILFDALDNTKYNNDESIDKPLGQISISSLYDEDFLTEQAEQRIFGRRGGQPLDNSLARRNLIDTTNYLMPISDSTVDEEKPSEAAPAASNSSKSDALDNKGGENQNKEDNMISAKTQDVMNEIDSSNIAETLQGSPDTVTKRDTKGRFLPSLKQVYTNEEATSASNTKFTPTSLREELSLIKNKDINMESEEGIDKLKTAQADINLQFLDDDIDDSFAALDKDYSLPKIMQQWDSKVTNKKVKGKRHDKITDNGKDILPDDFSLLENIKTRQKQGTLETATDMKALKNDEKLETETIKDFQTIQEKIAKEHLKENSEVLKELKKALKEQEKLDEQIIRMNALGKKRNNQTSTENIPTKNKKGKR